MMHMTGQQAGHGDIWRRYMHKKHLKNILLQDAQVPDDATLNCTGRQKSCLATCKSSEDSAVIIPLSNCKTIIILASTRERTAAKHGEKQEYTTTGALHQPLTPVVCIHCDEWDC
jgi:hypothetical protein